MHADKNRELAALTRWRRDLHRIPELDDDLPETLAYLRAEHQGVADSLSYVTSADYNDFV